MTRITEKQRDYLEILWGRLGRSTEPIAYMSKDEASEEIYQARKALGIDERAPRRAQQAHSGNHGVHLARKQGYEQGVREGYEFGYLAGRRDAQPASKVDDELLKQLIRLCHPDAHPAERFELANAATARLNAMRRDGTSEGRTFR